MKFQLEIADRLRSVEVRQHAQGYQVIVDGRPLVVDAAPIGSDAWSLIVRDDQSAARRTVEAVVVQNGGGAVDVHIDGYRIPVVLTNGMRGRARSPAASMAAHKSSTGPQRITAPMPGKVVRVLVSPGDAVKARQGLVVVEAMKMENELRASRDAHVRDVFVSEGQSVEAGTVLVALE
jgi:acetyl/propionyl-CoA carboxylase alpha subunit